MYPSNGFAVSAGGFPEQNPPMKFQMCIKLMIEEGTYLVEWKCNFLLSALSNDLKILNKLQLHSLTLAEGYDKCTAVVTKAPLRMTKK